MRKKFANSTIYPNDGKTNESLYTLCLYAYSNESVITVSCIWYASARLPQRKFLFIRLGLKKPKIYASQWQFNDSRVEVLTNCKKQSNIFICEVISP